ncbi:MAG: EAL domain-containing protein [Prochloraceae cyanobacterium]|nr:EAL domain-containing protein [Prochloraceae cyanobacterium]
MNLKSLKISEKLTIGFLGTSLLLLGLGIVYIKRDYDIKNQTDRVIKAIALEAKTATDMSESLQQIQIYAGELLYADRTNRQTYLSYKTKIQAELKRLNKDVALGKSAILTETRTTLNALEKQKSTRIERSKTSDKEFQTIQELREQIFIYQDNIARFLSYLENNNLERAQNIFDVEIKSQIQNKLLPLIYKYQVLSLKEIEGANEVINEKLATSLNAIVTYTILSIIFALALYTYIYRSTYPPIQQLQKAAIEVGKGKLNTKVYPKNPDDELGILATTFNSMLSGLQETTVSKSYLTNIIDSMADSLIVINTKGTIKKINQATLELLGYSNREELINNRIFNVISEECNFNLKRLIEENNFPFKCETSYITKEKEIIPVAFSIAAIVSGENDKIEGMVCVARDITERHRSQQALQQSEERYSLAAEAVNDGIWDYQVKNEEIYLSPRWKTMLGYQDSEIENNIDNWFKLIHPEDQGKFQEQFYAYIKGVNLEFEISYRIKHKDGDYLRVLCRGTAVRDERGKVSRVVGAQTDITDRKRNEERLLFEAFHDRLTGLLNRNYLFDRLAQLIEKSQEKESFFALMLLDIDRFKAIENSLGHFGADRILIEMGQRLSQSLDSVHKIARLEGDGFGIILEDLQYSSEVTEIAEKILKQVATPFEIEQRQIFITVSIGIALNNRYYNRVDETIADANAALLQVKKSGKANYAIFEPSMRIESLNFIETENELREAIKRKEFGVVYQPILEIDSEKIVGFEALLRWNHPKRGSISPSQFIEIANETRLILQINWEVLRQVCTQMTKWQTKYPRSKVFASVNISELQFAQVDFHNYLAKIVRETGVQPNRLQLEITETAIIEDIDRATFVLQQLKDFGVKISMDDFGTGYSALSHLHNLPINNLKIDRSFFKNIEIDRQRFEVMKSIINLGLALEISPVAEGVETTDELNKLRELNCQYAQGYLFYRPMDLEKTEALIAEQYLHLQSQQTRI